jgi:ABC-2 type transport system permease protein
VKLQPGLIWELARKDLRLFLADRRGALLCFAVPIVLASAFGMIFHRPEGEEAIRLPLLVVAEDDSPLTRRVVAALCASDKLEVTTLDRAAAVARINDRGEGVALVLPAGFGKVGTWEKAGDVPEVELLHHPSSVLESRWAEGVFTEVVLREAAKEWLAPLKRAHPGLEVRKPFRVGHSAVLGHGGSCFVDSYSHSFCGMTLQYLLFWGVDSGLLFLRERRRGIWRRLRIAPVSWPTLLAGKALATALVALAQVAVTFAFGYLVFGVTVGGSVVGFVALAVAAALLCAATGLVVAALGGNEARARSVAIVVILISSMLGGLWLPSFLLPRWVQTLSWALPTTWAVRGLGGVTWQGMTWAPALRCAGVVVGFSLAFLLVALWGLARSERTQKCPLRG